LSGSDLLVLLTRRKAAAASVAVCRTHTIAYYKTRSIWQQREARKPTKSQWRARKLTRVRFGARLIMSPEQVVELLVRVVGYASVACRDNVPICVETRDVVANRYDHPEAHVRYTKERKKTPHCLCFRPVRELKLIVRELKVRV
jgi:hypothetical protein